MSRSLLGARSLRKSCAARRLGDEPGTSAGAVQAGDPVIVVEEEFSLGQGVSLALSFQKNFAPQKVLYRNGKSAPGAGVGNLAAWKIAPGDPEPVFVLEPWLHWWERLRQGTWFGLFRDDEPHLLAIGACQASLWVDPQSDRRLQTVPQILATHADQDVKLTFPLEKGCRRWLIASVDREASLAPLRDSNLCRAPLPQQVFIRHGDFPLDLVKDCVIDWPGPHDDYPRLFLRKADLPRLRGSFKGDPARLAQYIQQPVSAYALEEPFRYYFGTGNARLGDHLAEAAVQHLQQAVQLYLEQGELMGPGFAPHHQTVVIIAALLADAILGTDALKPALRRRARAQLAFLGYTVDRPDFWSPERGFSANPNMTTTVAAFKTILACTIPSHPLASTWARHGLAELKDHQLDHWSDAHGGWLEAPHYAMVSFDYLLGCFIMAHNAGFGDYLYDPKMRKIIEWFAKISTPPDSRLFGHRHFPPIGNTYISEPTGEFDGPGLLLERSRSPICLPHAVDGPAAWVAADSGRRRFLPDPGRLSDHPSR